MIYFLDKDESVRRERQEDQEEKWLQDHFILYG